MRINYKWGVIIGLLILSIGTTSAVIAEYNHNKELESTIQKQIKDLHATQNDKIKTQEQIINSLKSEIKVKETELQTKRSNAQRLAEAARSVLNVQSANAAPTTPQNGSDAFYKAYIYGHESGNRTNAVNPIGACGLGQALPCSKMPCSLSDYACQDNFFTNYAIKRYGSWANAYNFWVAHKWW